MSQTFATVSLLGRHDDPRVTEPLIALGDFLHTRGITALAQATDTDLGPTVETGPLQSIVQRADLLMAVGGDGTMLHAAGLAAEHDAPILGINRGRLGFLADIGADDMLERVADVLDGKFTTEKRVMLEACIEGREEICYGLNDIVLQKWDVGRMLEFETWVDGTYVNTHGGDGLIVATPTGSTAYALSCGGPILSPSLEALALVPICPHTLSDRPIVVPKAAQIEIRLGHRADTRAQVTCDGATLAEIHPGERLTVKVSKRHVTLLHPHNYDYYKTLRLKLRWGRGREARPGEI